MTKEQYQEALQINRYIDSLKDFVSHLEYDKSIQINYPHLDTSHFLDPVIRNNITSYIHINEALIKSELLGFVNDEILKLEDKMKHI